MPDPLYFNRLLIYFIHWKVIISNWWNTELKRPNPWNYYLCPNDGGDDDDDDDDDDNDDDDDFAYFVLDGYMAWWKASINGTE